MTATRYGLLGDSTVQATGPAGQTVSQTLGGEGTWPERLADMLGALPGIGPLLSAGRRGTWLGILAGGNNEWAFTSGANAWTAVASTDPWDLMLGQGVYGSGINKVATYTVPPLSRPLVGVEVDYADYSDGGSRVGGNWQYNLNGAGWVNMGQALSHNNKINRFYISAALTAGQTIQFRCYDGTADCGCGLFDIEPVYSTAANGIIIDNLAINGWRLDLNVTTTSGDRLACIDSVVLQPSALRNPKPAAGLLNMNVNDRAIQNTTTWATDLGLLNTRIAVTNGIPLTLMEAWECATAIYGNAANQAAYRAQTATSAAGFATPAKVLDLYNMFVARGLTGSTAVASAGYLLSDVVHESRLGHREVAYRTLWLVRNLLGIGNLPTVSPVVGKLAVPAYSGTRPAVAYTGAAPVSIG